MAQGASPTPTERLAKGYGLMIQAGEKPASREEIEQFMGEVERGASVVDALSTIRTMTATAQSGTSVNVPDPRGLPSEFQKQPTWRTTEEYLESNVRPGSSLDIESGGSPYDRVALATRRNKESQYRYLASKFQPENVRLDDEGEWVIRQTQADGSTKEIRMDERKISGKDFLDLAVSAPELVISMIATMRGGKGPVGQAAAGAAGWAGTGMLKDVLANISQAEQPDMGEIIKSRGIDFAIDTIVGGALGKGAQLFFSKTPKLAGLVPESGDIAEVGRAGVDVVEKGTGIKLAQSGAEVTGSTSLASLEGLLEKFPIIKRSREKFRAFKRSQELRTAEAILGPRPSSADVPGRLRSAVMSKADEAEGAVAAARAESVQGAESDLAQIFKEVDAPGREAFELGTQYSASAQDMLNTAKAANDLNYKAVYELPEASEDVFSLDPVSNKAKELLRSLSSVPDAEGGRELISALLKGQGLPELEGLAALAGRKTRLFDLVQMRSQIRNLLEQRGNEPIGNIPGNTLKQLSASITKAIDEGAEGLADGELKRRLKFANAEYKKFRNKFDDPDVEGLIVPRREGGIDPEAYVESLYSGGRGDRTKYDKLQEFFGPDSPEIVQTKQYFLDKIMGSSRDPITDKVVPGRLSASMEKLSDRISKDLFGDKAQDVSVIARELSAADPDGKLNFQEFLGLVGEGKVSSSRIRKLMAAEEARDQAYRNGIVEFFRTGNPIEIEPKEVVSRIINGKHSIAEIKEVLDLIAARDSDLLESVRWNYLRDFFQKVSNNKITPDEYVSFRKGKSMENLSGKDWVEHAGKREVRKVMETVLDPARMKLIDGLGDYMASAAAIEAAKSGSGGIAGSMTMYHLLMGSVGALRKTVQYAVIGSILASNRLGQFFTRLSKLPTDSIQFDPRLVKGVVGAFVRSPEFTRFLFEGGADEAEVNEMLDELEAAGFPTYNPEEP